MNQWRCAISDIHAVEISFEVRQVKSMVDRSVNITLNLPEYCQEQAAQIMKWVGYAGRGILEVAEKQEINTNDTLGTGSIRKSTRASA